MIDLRELAGSEFDLDLLGPEMNSATDLAALHTAILPSGSRTPVIEGRHLDWIEAERDALAVFLREVKTRDDVALGAALFDVHRFRRAAGRAVHQGREPGKTTKAFWRSTARRRTLSGERCLGSLLKLETKLVCAQRSTGSPVGSSTARKSFGSKRSGQAPPPLNSDTPVGNITNEQPAIPVEVNVAVPEVILNGAAATANLGSKQTQTSDGTDIRREVVVFHSVPVTLSKRGAWEVTSGWQYTNSAAPTPNASWCYVEGSQKGLSIYLSRNGTAMRGSSQIARSALGLSEADIRRAARACLWSGEVSDCPYPSDRSPHRRSHRPALRLGSGSCRGLRPRCRYDHRRQHQGPTEWRRRPRDVDGRWQGSQTLDDQLSRWQAHRVRAERPAFTRPDDRHLLCRRRGHRCWRDQRRSGPGLRPVFG